MKHLLLLSCIFLTACCQGVIYRPSQQSQTHSNNGVHFGTPSEPLAHTHRGLNPVSQTMDSIGNQ